MTDNEIKDMFERRNEEARRRLNNSVDVGLMDEDPLAFFNKENEMDKNEQRGNIVKIDPVEEFVDKEKLSTKILSGVIMTCIGICAITATIAFVKFMLF